MECLVGLICVIGTAGSNLPEGNRLELRYHRGRATVSGEEFMETVWQIWQDMVRIGIPLPTEDFDRTLYCGFLAIADSQLDE